MKASMIRPKERRHDENRCNENARRAEGEYERKAGALIRRPLQNVWERRRPVTEPAPPELRCFLDPVDERGGLGQTQNLDRDAAQQQPRKAAATVAADKDQVATVFFGRLNDAVGHIEVGN